MRSRLSIATADSRSASSVRHLGAIRQHGLLRLLGHERRVDRGQRQAGAGRLIAGGLGIDAGELQRLRLCQDPVEVCLAQGGAIGLGFDGCFIQVAVDDLDVALYLSGDDRVAITNPGRALPLSQRAAVRGDRPGSLDLVAADSRRGLARSLLF